MGQSHQAKRVRVMLVEDHRMVGQALSVMLEAHPRFEIVANAASGAEAIRLAAKAKPDLVLLDVELPDVDGAEVARQLQEKGDGVKIVAVTKCDDPAVVYNVLRAGARGYVLKIEGLEQLLFAIEQVMGGGQYLSARLDEALRQNEGNVEISQKLSPRERQVLKMVAEGRSSRQIAQELELSVKTVETYRRTTMDKLKVDGAADLTRFALRMGLVRL